MFGCIGAIKESTAWINVYGLLLLFIFVLQIIAALFAYSLQGQIHNMLEKTMNESLYEYETDPYVSDTVDFLQGSVSFLIYQFFKQNFDMFTLLFIFL